ncbi:transcription termination/antitermination NusG family protein [Roseburia hominis]
MWYVIQTMSGQEDSLVKMVKKQLSKECYADCFYIKREYTLKIGGEYRVYLKPLFPAYVFIQTDSPEEVYFELKNIPKLSKLLASEGEMFLRVAEDEQEFLESIQDETHVVRRSLVRVDEEGQIVAAEGALGEYLGCMVRQRLRKRSVWIEKELLGEVREILLGVRLETD